MACLRGKAAEIHTEERHRPVPTFIGREIEQDFLIRRAGKPGVLRHLPL